MSLVTHNRGTHLSAKATDKTPIRPLFGLRLWQVMVMACILVLPCSCIHTYPKPDRLTDPTEISVALMLNFSDEWGDLHGALRANERADGWLQRIYISLRDKNGSATGFTTTVSSEEIADGQYRLELPSRLKASKYFIAVWADYINPVTLQPIAYDISTPSLIRELIPRGEETDARRCLTALGEFDLTHLSGKWDASEEVNLTLSSPMARIRLVADDYSDFLSQTAEARLRGEHYYVSVAYDSEIAGGFSLPDGIAMDPVGGCGFTADLPVISMPGIEMCIASDWLFNPSGRYVYTLTVSVFNSAKAMVSQTAGIPIEAERGKITTVSGKLLTNFISGGITIDNLWEGEIVIEIP